ncbi:MAG: hypothetical protein P1P88_02695 [Bacteroidales bacterium]|nr:hypothetical protein [Bacteroidales bacterium]
MNEIKVLYLTLSNDDAYSRLNELPFQNDNIKLHIDPVFSTIKCWNDFYFGAIDSKLSLENIFLTDKDKMKLNISFINKIVDSLGWNNNKVVFATHWGSKTLGEYKAFLKEISIPGDKIQPSYWGTQSKSYTCNDYDRIKNEIIELAYPDIYLPLHEVKEIIDIQKANSAHLKELNNSGLKENIDKILQEIKNSCDTFWQLP